MTFCNKFIYLLDLVDNYFLMLQKIYDDLNKSEILKADIDIAPDCKLIVDISKKSLFINLHWNKVRIPFWDQESDMVNFNKFCADLLQFSRWLNQLAIRYQYENNDVIDNNTQTASCIKQSTCPDIYSFYLKLNFYMRNIRIWRKWYLQNDLRKGILASYHTYSIFTRLSAELKWQGNALIWIKNNNPSLTIINEIVHVLALLLRDFNLYIRSSKWLCESYISIYNLLYKRSNLF